MLTFSKNIITNYKLADGTTIDNGFEYNIIDKAQLLYAKNYYWLSYETKQYLVDKFFQITDKETNTKIGYYELSGWNIFSRYKDKLLWEGQEYKFKKIKPEIRYSLLNKDTWGHFKFQLSKDNEIVIYSFKIDTPAISIGNPYTEKSFEGYIEIKNTTLLTALAGLILVERALDNESIPSN